MTPATARRARRRQQRGMSLIEVLVVVTLIAIMTGAIVFGSGMLVGARQRAAATLVLGSVRMGLARANQIGRATRLVFDFETHRVSLEESQSGALLRRVKEEGEGTGAGAEPGTEAERAAREEADRIIKGPRAPRPSFSPVAGFADPMEGADAGAGRSLGKGVVFRQVQTEHDAEPRTSGRAYLYFWPGGMTERAAIQLRRDGAEDGITVLVSGLTGRVRVERGQVSLPEPRSEEGYSEREDTE